MIQNEILDYLLQCSFIRHVRQLDAISVRGRKICNKYRQAGWPDIVGTLRGGRALLIEVKKEKGKVTEEQHTFILAEQMNGSFAMIARSLDQVIEALKLEGYLG